MREIGFQRLNLLFIALATEVPESNELVMADNRSKGLPYRSFWYHVEHPARRRVDHLNAASLVGDHDAIRHVFQDGGKTHPLLGKSRDLFLHLFAQKIEGAGELAHFILCGG